MSSGDMTRPHFPEEGELFCPTCDTSFRGALDVCPTDGTMLIRLRPVRDPLIGRTLDGRFLVKERLGSGGMGAVYLAVQTSIGREVAIKVIESRRTAGNLAAKRFLREAKLSSRLSQPNIVTVLDFGQTEEGLLYLVMELITGRTLGDALAAEGRFAFGRVVRIGLQLCDALEAAHRLAIVHRDLKPSNVILLDEPAGRDAVKVLDFGLAKSLTGEEESRTMTQSDAIVGTPNYMPPEAVLHARFDLRSDLYSLGVILYELLSAQLPFAGTSIQAMLRQHAYEPPRPLPPDVPAAMQALLARLLEKEPDHRPQTAAETRAALTEIAAGMSQANDDRRGLRLPSSPGVAASPAVGSSSGDRGRETIVVRRRRWDWVAIAGVAAVVAVILAIALRDDPRLALSAPPAAEEAALAPPTVTAAPEPAGKDPAAVAPAEDVVVIRLVADPPATVWLDGEDLGKSPVHVTRQRGSRSLQVRFERPGYLARELTVVPDKSAEYRRQLDRKPVARRTPERTAPVRSSPSTVPAASERPAVRWVKPSK